jgi:hypothetical protein
MGLINDGAGKSLSAGALTTWEDPVMNVKSAAFNVDVTHMPYFVFENVRFLGFEGSLQFDQTTANVFQMTIPFMYRRSYKIDLMPYVSK